MLDQLYFRPFRTWLTALAEADADLLITHFIPLFRNIFVPCIFADCHLQIRQKWQMHKETGTPVSIFTKNMLMNF